MIYRLLVRAQIFVLALMLSTAIGCKTNRASRAPNARPNTGPTASQASVAIAKPTPLKLEGAARDKARKQLGMSDAELETAIKLQPLIAQVSAQAKLDPNLLNAIILHESRFNPRAHNRSGAKGLMQLMPKTSRHLAKTLGRRNRPYDPDFAIHAGALLLSTLQQKFDGSVDLALFGFAQGSGKVRAWKKRKGPYPKRVRTFIKKIKHNQAAFRSFGFPGE